MSLDQLKLFLAVANTGSFSRAAQVSDVTQSAISKRIFQLELQLGHRLFDRHGRGATLTDAGRVLVRHAESLLRDADQPQGGGIGAHVLRRLYKHELRLWWLRRLRAGRRCGKGETDNEGDKRSAHDGRLLLARRRRDAKGESGPERAE